MENLNIENTTVELSDWKKALNKYHDISLKFNIIFVDPPYEYDVYEKILNKVIELDLLKDNGIIVLEHANKKFTNNYDGLNMYKEKNYKDKSITIYKKI